MEQSSNIANATILETLNPAQKEAVSTMAQHCLVLAGAGSGKTKVLVHRIAFLIDVLRVSPYGILAVTFTNKAAGEMKVRVGNIIENVGGIWLGTFHSIALRILRQYHQEANLPSSFQILDASDQTRLVKRLIVDMHYDVKQFEPKKVTGFINACKENGERSHQVTDDNNSLKRSMIQIYQQYENQTQRSGLVDFTELLLRSYELLTNNVSVLEQFRKRFAHVLVDEFQDTNSLQFAWLKLLVGKEAGLFVVGDDDQSIYGWRGAKIEHIQNFNHSFPTAALVRLEQNYRSTSVILKAANSVINHNTSRLGKNLWTDGEEGELIKIYNAHNEHNEAEFIVSTAQQWQDMGKPLSVAAVLYRNNALSRVLENQLVRANLPYRVYGGMKFFDRAVVKDALSYGRLVINRHDDAAFDRVLNVPPRGIGAKSAEKIRQYAQEHSLSLWSASKECIMQEKSLAKVQEFIAIIDRLDNELPADLGKQFASMIENSGLRSHYQNQINTNIDSQAQTRLENLDELINAGDEFQAGYISTQQEIVPSVMLATFLEQAALDSSEQQATSNQDCLQLMTIHASKGLEFELVMIMGMEGGLFPSQMALNTTHGLEEERRLAYVGITRAEKHLVMSYAETRMWNGKLNYNQASSFIAELPRELVHHVRPQAYQSHNHSYDLPTTANYKQTDDTNQQFRIGDRLKHSRFGEGVLLSMKKDNNDYILEVFFDYAGKKNLLQSLANLTLA